MTQSKSSAPLLSLLFRPRVNALSRSVFRFAIIVTAILLPLDRVGFLSWLHITILTLILVAQRWFYVKAYNWHTKQAAENNKLAYLLLLPALAVLIVQATSSLVHPLNHAAFTIIVLAIKAFMLIQLVNEDDLTLFENTTFVVCAVVVAFGFYQYMAGAFRAPLWVSGLSPQYAAGWTFFFPRPQSTALEPLYFGFYLLLPLSLLTLRQLRGQLTAKWLRLTLLGSLTLLILTLSRGAIVGFIIASIVGIVAMKPQRKRITELGIVILQAVALTLVLTLFASVVSKGNLSTFDKHLVNLNDKSAQTRYQGINPAIRAFLQRPLTGHGIVNVGDHAGAKLKVNNTYLTILVEQGLLGFLLYLPIVGVFIYCLIRSFSNKLNSRYAPYVLTLIAMGIQATTFEAFQLLRLWVVMAMLVVALQIELRRELKVKHSTP